jgi:hypothetical protein
MRDRKRIGTQRQRYGERYAPLVRDSRLLSVFQPQSTGPAQRFLTSFVPPHAPNPPFTMTHYLGHGCHSRFICYNPCLKRGDLEVEMPELDRKCCSALLATWEYCTESHMGDLARENTSSTGEEDCPGSLIAGTEQGSMHRLSNPMVT